MGAWLNYTIDSTAISTVMCKISYCVLTCLDDADRDIPLGSFKRVREVSLNGTNGFAFRVRV